MSLGQFIIGICGAIALAGLVASNLLAYHPVVFLTFKTIPLPLGVLALSAWTGGLLASICLRLLVGRRRTPPSPRRSSERYVPDDRANFAPDDPPSGEPLDREYLPPEPPHPDRATGQQIYDANYRVIRPPRDEATPPPQVNSRLDARDEDWGFDFDEDEH